MTYGWLYKRVRRSQERLLRKDTRKIMDLPPELVCLVFECCDSMLGPILRCVCSKWRALVSACRWEHKAHHRRASCLIRDKYYEGHMCSTVRHCAVHYAQLAINRGWWNVAEWMLDCAGPFDRVNSADMNACERIVIDRGDVDRLSVWAHKDTSKRHTKAWKWAARTGRMDVLSWLEDMGLLKDSGGALFRAAAKGGHIDVIQFLLNQRCDPESIRTGHVSTAAAKHGRLDVLEWLQARSAYICPFAGSYAARGGHIGVLVWLCEQGRTLAGEVLLLEAAGRGHLHVIEWLAARGRLSHSAAPYVAATGGHLEVLQWLVARHSCAFDASYSYIAADKGHWHVLRYLHENGCPWADSICAAIARQGHLPMLKWARARGCPWDESTCSSAAVGGHLKVLQWARDNGCPWDARTCTEAARCGHLDVLEWAVQNGCLPHGNDFEPVCAEAALGGHIHILRWARRHGFPWDASTCDGAAERGHFRVVMWLHDNGCPWTHRTCEHAAAIGHVRMLEWAHGHGCPLTVCACTRAIRNCHFDAVRWLHANSGPWSPELTRMARDSGYARLVKWAKGLDS